MYSLFRNGWINHIDMVLMWLIYFDYLFPSIFIYHSLNFTESLLLYEAVTASLVYSAHYTTLSAVADTHSN